MSISRRQRRRIFARDSFRCLWCGTSVLVGVSDPKRRATLDHVIPRSVGGSNRAGNLITCCQHHNEARANRLGPPPGLEHVTLPSYDDLEARYRNLTPPPLDGVILDHNSSQYRAYRRWWNKRGFWESAKQQLEEEVSAIA